METNLIKRIISIAKVAGIFLIGLLALLVLGVGIATLHFLTEFSL